MEKWLPKPCWYSRVVGKEECGAAAVAAVATVVVVVVVVVPFFFVMVLVMSCLCVRDGGSEGGKKICRQMLVAGSCVCVCVDVRM